MRPALAMCCVLAACTGDDEGSDATAVSAGTARWAISVGSGVSAGLTTAIDSLGDVIAGGHIGGTGFVTKRVASDGAERWMLRIEPRTPTSRSVVRGVAVGPNDAVIAVGLASEGPIGVAAQHGWRRVGEPMLVTSADANCVLELDGRPALQDLQRDVEARFGGPDDDGPPIPLPPFWGGWRIRPVTVEFWQGRVGRLHDRLRYRDTGDGWVVERLAP